MVIKRHNDELGDPMPHRAPWSTPVMHRASTPAERDAEGLKMFQDEGRNWVQEQQAKGRNIQFDHTILVGHDSMGSDTNTDQWTNVTTHRAWGTAIGHLFYQQPDQ